MKAQVGDTVISLTNNWDFTKGKEYEVVDRDSNCVYVIDDKGHEFFLHDDREYKLKEDNMKEFTVEVKDKALSKALQEVAFENGWKWCVNGRVIRQYNAPITFNSNTKKLENNNYKPDYTLPQDWNEVVAIISKPQFNVDDWVVVEKTDRYSNNSDGDIGKVTEIIKGKGLTHRVHVPNKANHGNWENPKYLRHATEQEIKQAQTKKFFEWDVKETGNSAKYIHIAPDCLEGIRIRKDSVESIIKHLNKLIKYGNSQITVRELKDELKKIIV